MSTSHLVLEAQDIRKTFHDPVTVEVLKGVSLEVKKGEFVSIIGKSGCGKSTLLYILSTMDTDYQGTLRLGGEITGRKSHAALAALRNAYIGFVFQFHYLLPEFSVLENVMLPGLKLARKSRAELEHHAMERLQMLGIADQALKKASMLSGGQKQRVAIARALINDPLIVMGDEPTGNLDRKNSDLVFDIFRDLASERGQALLVVTHDMEFAAKTDRIIEMDDGRIIT
jgi:lipoprotein-releasing system ATP-binding protein